MARTHLSAGIVSKGKGKGDDCNVRVPVDAVGLSPQHGAVACL